MGRTNKQEAARVKRFTEEAKALIEEQGRNVDDFDFDQVSDELEKLAAHLKGAGGSNAADDKAGTEAQASESEKANSEAQVKGESAGTVQDLESDARASAEGIIAGAEERAKVIIAEATMHANRIIDEAKSQAGDTSDAQKVEAVDPANLREYRNTGSVNVFTEGGRCFPNATVRLSEEEAENYPALELLGEDFDPASEVDEAE
ncbi:MAG: hypothetical protein KAT90_15060 [Gammaproteobacteria bacterium]|nr:hypothetical protein [Gammaproteobacteria bacterium]